MGGNKEVGREEGREGEGKKGGREGRRKGKNEGARVGQCRCSRCLSLAGGDGGVLGLPLSPRGPVLGLWVGVIGPRGIGRGRLQVSSAKRQAMRRSGWGFLQTNKQKKRPHKNIILWG